MADFDYDALSDLTLTLEAEDGSEVNLEITPHLQNRTIRNRLFISLH